MKIQLREGQSYSYYEIAQFFEIAPQSFKAHKFQKLEELKNYAIFHEENNRIIIDKVIGAAAFLGTLEERRAFKRIMFAAIQEQGNNNINEWALARQLKPHFRTFSIKDIIYYIRYYLDEYYGEQGLKGKKEYQFFKKENGKFLKLSKEETEKKNKLIKQWYGNLTERVLVAADMIDANIISKEEAWNLLNIQNSYKDFKEMAEKQLAAALSAGYEIIDGKDEIPHDEIDIEEELSEMEIIV